MIESLELNLKYKKTHKKQVKRPQTCHLTCFSNIYHSISEMKGVIQTKGGTPNINDRTPSSVGSPKKHPKLCLQYEYGNFLLDTKMNESKASKIRKLGLKNWNKTYST